MSDAADSLDIQAEIARIDRLLAETHADQQQRSGRLIVPWVLAVGMATGAVLFAAGAMFMKLLGG